MKRSTFLIALLALSAGSLLLAGCSDSSDDANNEAVDAGLSDANTDAQPDVITAPSEVQLSYDFESGKQDWTAEVTDYPDGAVGAIGFFASVRDLPDYMETAGKGFYLQGDNSQLDIFMYLKRQLGPDDGLQPKTSYRLNYKVTLASNYPEDCDEVQGQKDPGEKMYLKMGGSKWEPASKLSSDQSHHELNVSKGDAEVGGTAASSAGNITHDEACALVYNRYISMSREHAHTSVVETTDEGILWLLIGVDSEYNGETSFYVDKVEVTLTPQAE